MIRQRLTGLAACLVLLGIVAGLPAVLVAVAGNPLPDTWPTWAQITAGLTRPDNGTLALAVIVWIGWATWLTLAGSILLEILARAQGVHAPHLPALGGPQLAASAMLSAAALLFAATPLAAQASTSSATAAVSVSQQQQVGTGATAAVSDPTPGGGTRVGTAPLARHAGTPAPGAACITHLTRPGDTLWALAEQYLGDGYRYPQIAAANPELIGDPDFLGTGWALTIPVEATPAPTVRTYTVTEGDTLSGIAQDQLGDPHRYGDIVQASAHLTQPGGRHLQDPDLILPGWTLHIPDRPSSTPPQDTARPDNGTAIRKLTRQASDAARLGNNDHSTGQAVQEPTLPPGGLAAAAAAAAEETTEAVNRATRSAAGEAEPERPTPVATAPAAGEAEDVPDSRSAPWVLSGLAGAGVILAGSAGLLLRKHRRDQFRARRPGRAIPALDPVLEPVEKTLHIQEPTCGGLVAGIDHALRALAATSHEQGLVTPAVAAVQVSGDRLSVHLSEPAPLPDPWTRAGDATQWALHLSGQDHSAPAKRPAPYPLLVTIGEGDDGSVWLLNLEEFGTVALTGDATYAQDFARYLAAEVACNPWAQEVHLHCCQVATQAAGMNPARVHVHDDVDDAAGQVLAHTIAQTDRANQDNTTAPAARAAQLGEDLWLARLLLVDHTSSDTLGQLLDVVDQHPQQSGTAVVITVATGAEPTPPMDEHIALHITLTSTGRVRLPSVGLDLIAAGLTVDEASGIAALLQQSTLAGDRPVPYDQDAPAGTWRACTDHAGALRQDYTMPRAATGQAQPPADEQPAPTDHDATTPLVRTPGDTNHDPPSTLLPRPDEDYVHAAATTTQDLAVLSPTVSATVRDHLATLDPTLDADVAAWFADDCPLPRLAMLGPVKARTRGRAVAVAKSKDYYIELLAYLGTRPAGASMEEVTAAFASTPGTVRKHISHLRDWLGTNPRTGQPHLPDARKAPAAQARGVGVYQVQDLLIDADLFRRLRVRGQTLGEAGMPDLCTALRLVTGTPLDPGSLRPTGWSWMLEGDRLDQHLLVAVVDVAHLVTTASLTDGDLTGAAAATKVALRAAPEEQIPRLDLAAIAAATGDEDQARRIIGQDVANRCDDDGSGPHDLPERTKTVLQTRAWPSRHAS